MLRIALVDDDPKDLAHNQGVLKRYFALRPHLAGDLTAFSSAGELLEAVQQKEFDVYLLDVIMPGANGIELGQKLRAVGRHGAIIYLTFSPDFAVDSYTARAFYYLLKPVPQERLFQVLDEAVNHLSRQQEESVLVRCREGMRRLVVGQVIFAELAEKRLCCHMASGEVVQSVSLRESFREAAAGFLAHRAFAMCGVSFAVNLGRVTGVTRNMVQLEGGGSLPLSRAYRESFIGLWMDYHLEGGR